MAILLHAISFYGCLHRTTAQRRQKVHKKESILQKMPNTQNTKGT